ncbi:hypothetical protein AB0K52_12455 [Glycomyces sp. NPDC049804]|uniref:hypothetical protein n=1 Tax=Glycomyces sp. NPDC049804 TaxID=3154363 RepID=UPI00342F72CA
MRYPWLSAERRRRLRGFPQDLPQGLEGVGAGIDAVRESFEAPEARVLRGQWPGGSDWYFRARQPLAQVVYFPARVNWLCEDLREEARKVAPVAVPLSPPVEPTHPLHIEPPDALQVLSGWGYSTLQRSEWRAQPPKRIRRWLEAARAYVARQAEIIAGLSDWAGSAAELKSRDPRNARRLVEAFGPQREALDGLLEASAGYEAELQSIRKFAPGHDRPWYEDPHDPVNQLWEWGRSRRWAVVPSGRRGVRILNSEADGVRLKWVEGKPVLKVDGLAFWAVSLESIAGRLKSDDVPAAVPVWDEPSLGFADAAVAKRWKRVRHEHNLPGDFASAWLALFGTDHRTGRISEPWGDRVRPRTARSAYGNWGGGGGGFDGSAIAGADSGGSDGGGGGE